MFKTKSFKYNKKTDTILAVETKEQPEWKNFSKHSAKAKPSVNIYRPPTARDLPSTHCDFAEDDVAIVRNDSQSQSLNMSFHMKRPKSFTYEQYPQISNNIRRSNSLGAHDTKNFKDFLQNIQFEFAGFQPENQLLLKLALKNPNQLSSRHIMDLVQLILDRSVQGINYCELGAKICLSIIEKEKNPTFLESLVNICQQWYQERDQILRGFKLKDGTRFTAFMWFLTETYGQLKRHHLNEESQLLQPDLVLLSILVKCCQACVSLPITCALETECLFFVLISIGRNLEAELPQQLEQLMTSIRDGFLAIGCPSTVRRTLLQLIELHASDWQLPGSSVLYYFPRNK